MFLATLLSQVTNLAGGLYESKSVNRFTHISNLNLFDFML